MSRILTVFICFFSFAALACDLPEANLESHFREQWEDEGELQRSEHRIGKTKVVVLAHPSSCGLRGCEHSVYYVSKRCAREGLVVAGRLRWSPDFSELTVSRKALPTEVERRDRVFAFDQKSQSYVEQK